MSVADVTPEAFAQMLWSELRFARRGLTAGDLVVALAGRVSLWRMPLFDLLDTWAAKGLIATTDRGRRWTMTFDAARLRQPPRLAQLETRLPHERLWVAARALRRFSLAELAVSASVSTTAALSWLRSAERVGWMCRMPNSRAHWTSGPREMGPRPARLQIAMIDGVRAIRISDPNAATPEQIIPFSQARQSVAAATVGGA